MQSHLDTDYPWPALYKQTLQDFLKEGFEVQISELDVTCKDSATQAKYYYDLMSAIMEVKKASDKDDNSGKITALIFWGITDEDSWRSANSPLLYADYFTPKAAYEQCLKAYEDSGYVPTVVDNILLGDVNNDGKVNISDYTVLRKYIETDGECTINEKNSDINKEVNFLDLLKLKSLI